MKDREIEGFLETEVDEAKGAKGLDNGTITGVIQALHIIQVQGPFQSGQQIERVCLDGRGISTASHPLTQPICTLWLQLI